MDADKKRFTHAIRNATNCKSPPGGRQPQKTWSATCELRARGGAWQKVKGSCPPEPHGLQQFVRQKNPGSSTQTATHHHDRNGAALNINLHAIDNSHVHDTSESERNMSQSNSDPDPESTDERKEEHKIKHFSLDKRGATIS